jgi:hypothetical protein
VHRAGVSTLLFKVGTLVRAGVGGGRTNDRRGADLMGARLRGTDLRDANLAGAVFVTQAQRWTPQPAIRGEDPYALARPAHWN